MPRASGFVGRRVLGADGRELGRVSALLFHAREPRVVGVQVDRPAVAGVFDRRPHFVLLGDLEVTDDGMSFRLGTNRLPEDGPGERALGFSWHDSVIWQRMPVASAVGDPVGHVHDIVFDADGGAIAVLRVSSGVIGDAAVGMLEVPGELVRGFDGEAVVVLPGYADMRADGGAARAVAVGVAAARTRGGAVADGALQVGVAASRALGRSIRGGLVRKAIDGVKSLTREEDGD